MESLKSNSGFTMIDALMAAGIASMVVVSFMGMGTMAGKGITSVNTNDRIGAVMRHVNMAFGNSDTFCQRILGGQALAAAPADGLPIAGIDFTDPFSGAILSNVVTANPDLNINGVMGLAVQDIRLLPVSTINTALMIASLELRFANTGANNPTLTIRRIPIFATLDPAGKISSCTLTPTSSAAIKERECEMTNYGFNHWDEVTNGCVPNDGVTWERGATSQATCPTGSKLAVPDDETALDPGVLCKVKNAVAATLNNRIYEDGTTDSMPVIASVVKIDRINQCDFVYADGTDTTLAETYVKCVRQP
jgi:hypothetical protein